MRRVLRRESPDHVIHLGDCVRDAQGLSDIPLTQVPGNCDYGFPLPEVLTPTLASVRLYMTHGHLHGVKTTYQRAIYAALEANAGVLLFGHTHRPECFLERGLWVLNPGACNARGSYGVLQIQDGSVSCRVKSVNEKE